VFLLLTLPLLGRWAMERRAFAAVTLVALFGTLWLDVAWSNVPVMGRAPRGVERHDGRRAVGQPLPLAVLFNSSSSPD